MERRPSSLELPFSPVEATPSEPRPAAPRAAPQRLVLSVAELDRRLKSVVERATDEVEVEGEISGLKVVASGHSYFTLKDEREEATIDCVMYRTASPRGRQPARRRRSSRAGRARHGLRARGRLQLVADTARPAGRGAAARGAREAEGEARRRGPLRGGAASARCPADPRVIGVVTSADGAAIHDIVKVAARRRGPVRIVLAPRAGAGRRRGAAHHPGDRCARARCRGSRPSSSARGGGSADDLAAFNDEALARQVANARVPVVSAVGHEMDITLTDLAADARASTPSQAAELLVPDDVARRAEASRTSAAASSAPWRRSCGAIASPAGAAPGGSGSPERLLDERQQLVDDARMRLRAEMTRPLGQRRASVERLDRRLAGGHPSAVLAAREPRSGRSRCASARPRAGSSPRATRLGRSAARLDALSPLAVLARGYAIATDANGRALVDASAVRAGDRLRVRLHRGTLGDRGGRGGPSGHAEREARDAMTEKLSFSLLGHPVRHSVSPAMCAAAIHGARLAAQLQRHRRPLGDGLRRILHELKRGALGGATSRLRTSARSPRWWTTSRRARWRSAPPTSSRARRGPRRRPQHRRRGARRGAQRRSTCTRAAPSSSAPAAPASRRSSRRGAWGSRSSA